MGRRFSVWETQLRPATPHLPDSNAANGLDRLDTLNFKQFNKKGIVLHDTYEIINEIGQGGFSIVYLVNHKLRDET